jgi:hypothetical protein
MNLDSQDIRLRTRLHDIGQLNALIEMPCHEILRNVMATTLGAIVDILEQFDSAVKRCRVCMPDKICGHCIAERLAIRDLEAKVLNCQSLASIWFVENIKE